MRHDKITAGVLSVSILYEFLKQQYQLLPMEVRIAMIDTKEFCDKLQETKGEFDYEDLPFMIERPHVVREEQGQEDVIQQWYEFLCPKEVYKRHQTI